MITADLSHAAALLAAADDILIITHVRPDGDAAGSSCALCRGLRALGKCAYLAANPPSMARYEKYMLPYFAPTGFEPAFVAAVDTPGPAQFPAGWEHLAGRHPLAPGGTIGCGASPHRPGAKRRLLQASLHRLLFASGLPGSVLEHIFHKYPIPSRTILYKHMCHRADQLSILNDWTAAHALDDSASEG